jgi:hypothetical protein
MPPSILGIASTAPFQTPQRSPRRRAGSIAKTAVASDIVIMVKYSAGVSPL